MDGQGWCRADHIENQIDSLPEFVKPVGTVAVRCGVHFGSEYGLEALQFVAGSGHADVARARLAIWASATTDHGDECFRNRVVGRSRDDTPEEIGNSSRLPAQGGRLFVHVGHVGNSCKGSFHGLPHLPVSGTSL
jgi:hypothetical protein